jgi:hypothetical protein
MNSTTSKAVCKAGVKMKKALFQAYRHNMKIRKPSNLMEIIQFQSMIYKKKKSIQQFISQTKLFLIK